MEGTWPALDQNYDVKSTLEHSLLNISLSPMTTIAVDVAQKPEFGADSGFSTAFGGLMTGMLGVGIGEVVIPQLVKKNGVPLPVAAGTSVLIVFLNAVGETVAVDDITTVQQYLLPRTALLGCIASYCNEDVFRR